MQTEISTAETPTTHRPRLLFVDDEKRVLNSMRIMFKRQFELFLASHGSEALDIIKNKDIDVIIADHRMPQMTGVEVLSQVRELSPRTIRILLTGYADLNAVEGSINESEVFRFLTKPCAPQQLRDTVDLAVKLSQTEADAADDDELDDEVVNLILENESVTEVNPSATRPAVPTLQPSDIAVDPPAAPSASPEASSDTQAAVRRQAKSASKMGLGIIAFSADDDMLSTIQNAVQGRVPIYPASNIVKVIQILGEHRPGVLITDISDDKSAIQSMTAKLKEELPQLVTVAVSQHRDVLDMVWLINHGQIFRFLRKPLSPGRCAVSLQAALQQHRRLLKHPELCERQQVDTNEEAGLVDGVLSRIKGMKRLWTTT